VISYKVLTLKYRPQNLDELWAQEHIKVTLKQAILNNRLANAYLFAGPRGVGKTTTARILAKSINCKKGPTIYPCQECSNCIAITNSQSLDVLEIDGASNRGIDQVRELRENVKFMPSDAPYKIYIIDEVHMLTQEAFNALLKTLEEPPAHVKFIFATTAPQKVPLTILSRCQRFDFRKATEKEIVDRLKWISKQESITISDEALYGISKRADGSIRDAEGMLDQLRVFCADHIELKDVEQLFGLISNEIFFEYTEHLIKNDLKKIIEFIDKVFSLAYDFIEFYSGLLSHFRILLLLKLNALNPTTLGITERQLQKYQLQEKNFSLENLLGILQFLANNEAMVKYTSEPKILFEVISLRLSELVKVDSSKDCCLDDDVKLNKIWQMVLDQIRGEQPLLFAPLAHSKIQKIGEAELQVILSNALEKEFIDKEKATIEQMFSELLGRKVSMRSVLKPTTSESGSSDSETNLGTNSDKIIEAGTGKSKKNQ
jgi:DNA polymerase-3 subunit gamma/tau